MNRERQEAINRQIAEQAAEWVGTLENAGTEAQVAFADWVAESPRHLKEFLLMSVIDSELGRLDPHKQMDVGKLLAANNVVSLAVAETRSSGNLHVRKKWRWAAGVATLGVTSILSLWISSRTPSYETAIGEQRTVALTDGSMLQLNSKSRLRATLTDEARDIELLEGEAMFKVAPDPARPFRVHAGAATIQAIGTQFNVNRRPSGVTVSVIEGLVQVSNEPKAVLGAGEEVRLGRSGRIERRRNVDPVNISVWRQQRLVFRDDTLEDIIAEFNRYNTNSQIEIEGATLLSRRYTAVFDANDPASLVAFLSQDPELTVEQQKSALVIRQR
jgi:transmembrane sensor